LSRIINIMKFIIKAGLTMIIHFVLSCPLHAQQTFCTPNEIRTEIIIHSTPEAAWKLLTDFDQYPNWHPYLTSVTGELKLKHKIKASYLNADSTTGKFSAYILELAPNERLSWGGSLGFIFKAKHYYIIDQIDAHTIRFTQGEYWRGVFGKSYGKKIFQETFEKYKMMNVRMKEILEAS
jgi:hypothetical protein